MQKSFRKGLHFELKGKPWKIMEVLLVARLTREPMIMATLALAFLVSADLVISLDGKLKVSRVTVRHRKKLGKEVPKEFLELS